MGDASADEAVVTVQTGITPMSRSQTLHDPLTTQLLAEVARRVQTMELDIADPETSSRRSRRRGRAPAPASLPLG
jgi:hypothetical protein